ncbi:MAG: response regulator [Planctomycetota bacterium]
MPENFSVLIVEDDGDTRSNLEDVLSLDGYRLQAVSSCTDALAASREEKFDSIILDWRLPDGTGSQLIPQLKKELPGTPVIIITGVREFDTAVTALREGAYDFLSKPINPDALRGLLRRLVERKRHLDEIESAQERLVASERLAAIGQMVAGLAHESRNAFQRSHACLAELSLDLEEMPESLKLVHKVQRALDDVNLLLEEVRNYAAPILLDRREWEIEPLISSVWQQITEVGQTEDFPGLEVSVHQEELAWNVDKDRLQQVVRNLLENASFACVDGGPVIVEVSEIAHGQDQSPANSMLCVKVTDNGSGVPEGSGGQIFAPFYTTKTRGTGLGLAISRRIVEAHGGRLFVMSQGTDNGATFVMEIPAGK